MKLPFPVIGQSIERNVHALRETLFRVFESLSLPHHVAGGAWEYLQARYTEPCRHYHTLGHLVDMFNSAADLGVELSALESLAILYHDVIYEPGAKDNESRSADVLLGLRFPLAEICRSSIATDGHGAAQFPAARVLDMAAAVVRSTALFLEPELPVDAVYSLMVLDLDLSSFAKPYELFDMTNQLVRKEVNIDYATHAAFLSKFLEREFIYRTEAARNAWEQTARKNITRYVEGAVNEPAEA